MSYKDEQRTARESIRTVTPVEPLQADWHDEKGNLTLKGQNVLRTALNGPQEHHTVNLNIREFKRSIRRGAPFWLTKKEMRKAIRMYKEKAWLEYEKIVGSKGSFPSHPQYKEA